MRLLILHVDRFAYTVTDAARSALSSAEKASGSARKDALTTLSTQLNGDVSGSCDGARVQKLSNAVKDLANVAS